MRWDEFLARRERRLGRAVELAVAFRRGATDIPFPAGWGFAEDPTLVSLALEELRGAELRPDSDLVRAMTAPATAFRRPPAEEADAPERIHRRLLPTRLHAVTSHDADPLVWAFDELLFLGEQIETSERAPWRRRTWARDPEDDRVARLWSGWFAGDWPSRKRWDALFLADAARTFDGVLVAGKVPADARPGMVEEMCEQFYFQLVGGKGAVPGWLELAIRVLEATSTPLEFLPASLDAAGRDRAARCASRRGTWADTVARLHPDRVEVEARARSFSGALGDPRAVEAVVDLHVLRRVVAAWTAPGSGAPLTTWSIVTQNRGKASGRLRAVLARGDRGMLRDALLDLDALRARTADALRRYTWAWGWAHVDEENHGERIADPVEVTPPCVDLPPPPPPLTEEDRAVARTWILLCVLRGELGPLRRWARHGNLAEKDNRFYRLLADELPDRLRDPEAEGAAPRRGRYHRLRAWLVDALPAELDALVPVLGNVAAVPRGARDVLPRVQARLAPVWHTEEVRLPAGRYGAIVDAAGAAFAELTRVDSEEER